MIKQTSSLLGELAAVPAFVNAAAAVFPAVLGALASVVAALMKPRMFIPVLPGVGGYLWLGSTRGDSPDGNAVYALCVATDDALAAIGQDRPAWRSSTPLPPVGPITLADDLAFFGWGSNSFVFAPPAPREVLPQPVGPRQIERGAATSPTRRVKVLNTDHRPRQSKVFAPGLDWEPDVWAWLIVYIAAYVPVMLIAGLVLGVA